jgi:hypothetical protein
MSERVRKALAAAALGTALATAAPAAARTSAPDVTIGVIDNGISRGALKKLKDPNMEVESRVMHNGVQAGWTGDSYYSHGDLVAINAATAARAVSPDARIKILAANVYMPPDKQDLQNIRFRISYEAVHKAIDWFKQEGVKVVVFTGTGRDTQEMRDFAAHVRKEGMVLVASTNNAPSGEKVYPAAYPGVVAVAGTGAKLQIDRSPMLASYVGYVTDGRAMVKGSAMEEGSSFSAGTIAGYAAAWASHQKEFTRERLGAWLDSRGTAVEHSGRAIPTLAAPEGQKPLQTAEMQQAAPVKAVASVDEPSIAVLAAMSSGRGASR